MANKNINKEIPLIPCGWPECGLFFENSWDLNSHIEKHLSEYEYGEEPYPCTWINCDFRTESQQEFRRHAYYHGYYENLIIQGHYVLDTHPSVPKCTAPEMQQYKIPKLDEDFLCQWTECDRTFESIVEFQDHIVQHASFEYEMEKSPEDQRPKIECNWQFCKKKANNRYRLIEHIVCHTNKKQLACFTCGETFRNKTTLFDHLKRQPDNNTHKLQCGQCFKYFSTERLLRLHVIKHVNCYKCTMCDMSCASASALATHIRYRHLKDKPVECDECSMRFVGPNDLKRHKQLTHSKIVHMCCQPDCQFTSKNLSLLRKHFMAVHVNTPYIYACHCCEKYFKNGRSLSAHLMKEHDYQLPSGHKRFIYRPDENGMYRLETTRIESLEVTQQILTPSHSESSLPENGGFNIKNLHTGESVVVSNDPKKSKLMGEIIISLPNMT